MRLTIVLIDSFLLVARALFAVFWAETVSRTAGPLALRCLLQPLMASAFAICYEIRDARSNRMPVLTVIAKSPVACISRWMHWRRGARRDQFFEGR
jgi:hypothetical protein